MTLARRCSPLETQAPGAQLSSAPLFARARRGDLPLALELRHAGNIKTSLRYEVVGPDEAPLLVVCGGISAGRHVVSSGEFSEPGWWEVQSQAIGFDRFRVVSIDWIGADGTIDLPIDPADQALAVEQLLLELGPGKAAAFIGASYGGMVGMHLAASRPHCLGALLAISAAGHSHPYSSACRLLQRQALALGTSAGNPEAGVALARAMAMLTYRTAEEFAERFADPPSVEGSRVNVAAQAYLDAQGSRHCRKTSATAYQRLSESIDLHRITAREICVPCTFAAVDSDLLVPAADVQALAADVPGARLHLIHSNYGHDAFLKEAGQVAAIITHFLESLEDAQ